MAMRPTKQRKPCPTGRIAMYSSVIAFCALFFWIGRSQKKSIRIEIEPINDGINAYSNVNPEHARTEPLSNLESLTHSGLDPLDTNDQSTTNPTSSPSSDLNEEQSPDSLSSVIFHIGFDNVSTPSMLTFFARNGIRSVEESESLLSPDEVAAPSYRLAVDQNPGSKFILQIQSIVPWLRSKFIDYDGKHESVKWNGTVHDLKDYDEDTGNVLILKSWREQWYHYMCDALHFFQFERVELADSLLIFDIEQDDAQKIVDFAAGFGVDLKVKEIENRKDIERRGDEIQWKRWNVIVEKESIFAELDEYGSETERIMAQCLQRLYHDIDSC